MSYEAVRQSRHAGPRAVPVTMHMHVHCEFDAEFMPEDRWECDECSSGLDMLSRSESESESESEYDDTVCLHISSE